MTTMLRRKTPKSNHVNKTISKHGCLDSTAESLGVTISLSQTSHREEVSWSSSEGSTYYSDDELSLQQRRRASQQQEDNGVSASVRSNDLPTDNELTKDRLEENLSSKHSESSMAKKGPPIIASNHKKQLLVKKSLLKNVETFPAINIATDNEDVSAVGFLSIEDTAEVFCTNKIPFEVTANKRLYVKISAMSSSSTVESSIDSSDSESDEESQKHQEVISKGAASDSGYATARSETSDISSDETSVPTVDRHAVDVISVSYQDPVSSLECVSTWDDSSQDSDNSGDRSITDDKPRSQKNRKIPIHARRKLTSLQIDSKANRIKHMKRRKSEMITDERIKQLKAKIKSIQDLSNTTKSSTEVESNLSSPLPSQRIKGKKIVEHEEDASEPLVQRYDARGSRQPEETCRRSLEEHDIPLMIPVVGEGKPVSNLRFEGEDIDIEAGPLSGVGTQKACCEMNSIMDRTKILLGHGKTKVIASYDYIIPIIERKNAQFQKKPRYEQILIIAIGALISIFFILLFVMVGQ